MSRKSLKAGSRTFTVAADTRGEGQTIRPALLWVFRSENPDACRDPQSGRKVKGHGSTRGHTSCEAGRDVPRAKQRVISDGKRVELQVEGLCSVVCRWKVSRKAGPIPA